jgi:glycosyltransferase involved in cell wall biosynthesis
MRFDDVTAVLVTRDAEANPELDRIKASLPYGEVIVYDNSREDYNDNKVYGRYAGAELATRDIIFFQDDDVLLPREVHESLVENYKPGVLVTNMYDEWIEACGYYDLAMVGLGSIQDKDLWQEPFARYWDAHPDDDRFWLDPDFIYGVLAPWERYNFAGDAAQAQILDIASSPDRLWRQPEQMEGKWRTIQRARALRQVVLTILTKNEEKNLVRALNSADGLFQKLLIHDSGSTDDTYATAVDWCDAHDIPLHWRDTEWNGFAPARNALLEEGRFLGEYMLMMDADEEFVRPPDTAWPPLEMDVHVMHYEGPVDYGQPRLIRSNFPVRFAGKAHAALEWDYVARGVDLKAPTIKHHGDFTHGEGDVETRIRRDISLLSEDIDEGNDIPHNLFMRAKSYEGVGEWELARADYEARLECDDEGIEGIPAEQRYYALYRLGVLHVEKFNNFAEGADCLMTAWLDRPKRVESIRALAKYLTVIADGTPYPENEILLVHREMYSNPTQEVASHGT